MKALIIYDSFAAGAKASAALKHSMENLAFDVQWNVRPWRLDMLRFTPTLELAMADALGAHLIVLASRSAQPPPHWLLAWLEHWAKCRQVGEAAIAFFGIGDAVPRPPSTASQLTEFAKRHGVGLLFVDCDEFEDVGAIGVDSVRELMSDILSTPGHSLEAGTQGCLQG